MSTEAIAVEKPKRNYNVLFGLTLLALLVLLWIVLSVATPSFASGNNIANLLRQGSMIAIMAVGQTFVIITGGIDLSVGAVVGFATVVVAMMINAGFPVWLAILATLLVGVAIGLLMTNGNSINIKSDTFTAFSRSSFVGIPNLFWMVILVGVPAYIFLHHSRWGRYLFSVGSNAEASRLSGVNVQRTIYMAYTLSGLCAAFVGVLLADPGRGLGVAGDRLVGHRRHLAVRRRWLGARTTAWRFHPGHDQQRRQSAQCQLVLAAHHHRRVDHHHRLLRRPAPPRQVSQPHNQSPARHHCRAGDFTDWIEA